MDTNFISTVGVSYLPLHKEAIKTAKVTDKRIINNNSKISLASIEIQKAINKID